MKKAKPIVLTFVGSYLPGYKSGGPVRTIANMVERLDDDLDFRIITADRDVGDAEPYPNIVVNGWNTVGNAQVFYASPCNQSLWHLAQMINETPHDVLYLNSFFSPIFTIRPLLARRLGLTPNKPVILAARGEFADSCNHTIIVELQLSIGQAVVAQQTQKPADALSQGAFVARGEKVISGRR